MKYEEPYFEMPASHCDRNRYICYIDVTSIGMMLIKHS